MASFDDVGDVDQVYISGLPKRVTEEELGAYFGQIGQIKIDKKKKKPKVGGGVDRCLSWRPCKRKTRAWGPGKARISPPKDARCHQPLHLQPLPPPLTLAPHAAPALQIWLYRDKATGELKGDATVTYEDPFAASSAPSWFDGKEWNGVWGSLS